MRRIRFDCRFFLLHQNGSFPSEPSWTMDGLLDNRKFTDVSIDPHLTKWPIADPMGRTRRWIFKASRGQTKFEVTAIRYGSRRNETFFSLYASGLFLFLESFISRQWALTTRQQKMTDGTGVCRLGWNVSLKRSQKNCCQPFTVWTLL